MALTQILTTDSVSASVVNTKVVDPTNTALTGLQVAQTAGGTATAITLTGVELTNGYQKTFIINANNSGSATTVNGKPLYKPGGTVAPNLISGKAASIWYNLAGDCFFYKASAEGTATAGDVLAGVTFSNDNDTGISGTLALTGDALVSDVVIGKTFYNTDAKTKLTGTYSNIKSIQRGTVSMTTNTSVTISSIILTDSIVLLSVTDGGSKSFTLSSDITGILTGQTTLSLTRGAGTQTLMVQWQVIEFKNVKSLQSGSITNFSGSIAISSINTLKSFCLINFYNTSSITSPSSYPSVKILDSTHIEIDRGYNAQSGCNMFWQVIEFK